YQIPSGFLTCFPRGWIPSSVGSHTPTTISSSVPFFKYGVMSIEKGSKPPSCEPANCPLTYTSVFQSTAPKCNIHLIFLRPSSTETVFLYHRILFFPTRFPTPDKADSTGKGTNISPSKRSGISPDFSERIAYCHSPFRFCQSFLT